jgi:phosphopantothenate-cysteine ligase/phosphopantothenoylcysteine decarboxylase/phosphopantothenate--cysteine ligase
MPQTLRILVTAGNTREAIDRVRDWGNIFTGNTGYNIARTLKSSLAATGHNTHVDLCTSNPEHLSSARRQDIETHAFRSHADLNALLDRLMNKARYDAIYMTAAVADFRPAGAFEIVERIQRDDGTETWTVRPADAPKITSSLRALALLGEPTEKIVDRFRRDWAFAGHLVKFKLQVEMSDEELIRIAEASRLASQADLIVANTLAMTAGPDAGAFLIDPAGATRVTREELPSKLVDRLRKALRIT